MRIGVNATCIHDFSSGLGIATSAVTRELLRQDGDLLVYTVSRDLVRIDPERVRLATGLISPGRGTMGHVCRLLWCQTALPRMANRDGVDVLYSTVEEGVLWGARRQFVTVHDLLPLVYPEVYPRKKHVFRHILPRQLRRCEGVLCVSEFIRGDVIERFGIPEQRVFAVHDGLDHNLFRPVAGSLAKETYGLDRYFLYVGEMRPYKNLSRTLEAFAMLSAPECSFAIAGRKDRVFFPGLERRCFELGIADRVAFLDYVPREHLPHLYSSAIAFVFPSLYEGFGMPPVEAMACGCPVISSRAGGLAEACGEADLHVDPRNTEAIADGMRRVLEDEGLRSSLAHRGLDNAKRFSWSTTAAGVLRILRHAGGDATSGVAL